MNKFEFKNLVKNLKDTIKERTFFKDYVKKLRPVQTVLKITLLKKVLTKIQLQQPDSN